MLTNDPQLTRWLTRRPVSVVGADVTGPVESTIDCPSDGSVIAQAAWADPGAAGAALRQAKAAAMGWFRTPVERRAELLDRLAEELTARAELLVLAEALDTGKPLTAARRALDTAIEGLRAYGPKDIPPSGPFEQWEPVGTACAILPSNAALFTAGIRAGAALLSGCPIVLKPPPEAAVTVTMLAEFALDVGFPPGVLVSVPGGAEVGAALVQGHPDLVVFTGGAAGGSQVASAASTLGIAFRLELGGGAIVIVGPDADLERAADALVPASFGNQGQVCVSARIIRVPADHLDRFVERFVAGAGSLLVGPATDPATRFGPLQTRQRVREMEALMDRLPKVVTGGGRPADDSLPPDGYYFSPTVVIGPPPDPTEEVFGPVAFVVPYDELDLAVDETNAVTSGLAAGVWGSPETALAIASRLQAGQVYVNRHFNPTPGSVPGEPWGRSGVGRMGLEEHLRVRRIFAS